MSIAQLTDRTPATPRNRPAICSLTATCCPGAIDDAGTRTTMPCATSNPGSVDAMRSRLRRKSDAMTSRKREIATCATTKVCRILQVTGGGSRPAFLYVGSDVPLRRSQRGRDAADDGSEERYQGSVRDERQIGLKIDVRAAQTGQAVCAHHRREPDDEEQRGGRADGRKQQALGEKTLNDPPPACAEREAHGDFLAASGAAHHQQPGHIAARHEQHETEQSHQEGHERRRVSRVTRAAWMSVPGNTEATSFMLRFSVGNACSIRCPNAVNCDRA